MTPRENEGIHGAAKIDSLIHDKQRVTFLRLKIRPSFLAVITGDTGLDEIDAFHVIARTAFGDLYVCGEKTGCSVTIRCALNMVSALENELKEKTKEDQDFSVRFLFSYSEPAQLDMENEDGQPLFERVRAKLGALEPDEIYGFEPAIVLGGKFLLENLAKVNANVHLTILRQFAEPELPLAGIDIDKLLDS